MAQALRSITVLLVCSSLLSSPLIAAKEAKPRSIIAGFCQRNLRLLVLSAATMAMVPVANHYLTKAEEAQRVFDTVHRFYHDLTYRPDMPALQKYDAIFRIVEEGGVGAAEPSSKEILFSHLSRKGIPINGGTQQVPAQSFILEWIAKNDPDPKAQELAQRIEKEFGKLAHEVFGSLVAAYIPGGKSKENFQRLQQAAARGLSDSERFALRAVEYDDQGDDVQVHGQNQIIALYLRRAPGFLESAAVPGQSFEEWIDKAIEGVKPGDVRLAWVMKQRRGWFSEDQINRIVTKIGPESLGPLLTASYSLSAPILENPELYASALEKILNQKGLPEDKEQAIRVIRVLEKSPALAKKLNKSLLGLLDFPSRNIQINTIGVFEKTNSLPPGLMVERLGKMDKGPQCWFAPEGQMSKLNVNLDLLEYLSPSFDEKQMKEALQELGKISVPQNADPALVQKLLRIKKYLVGNLD